MVKRSLCLCDGKLIGIEWIYTVINGMQINNKERLAFMRRMAREKKLFCPCGCGSNLTVVAGDRNLRDQHFRILGAGEGDRCNYADVEEGETSVNSKVVLKCWLDEMLHDDDLEARVPICDASDSERKYEFTFLSRKNKIAVNYCRHRVNLSKEKLGILEQNAGGIGIVHVVDQENETTNFQFPEGMMKVQEWQGYCLALHVEGREYDKAEMKALIYEQNLDGLWEKVIVCKGLLKEYGFGVGNRLTLNGREVAVMAESARTRFMEDQEFYRQQREEYLKGLERHREQEHIERERRLEEQRLAEEQREKERAAEEERMRAEEERRQEEWRRGAEQRARERADEEAKRKAEEEEKIADSKKKFEDFWKNIDAEIARNDKQARTPDGVRIIKCRECGLLDDESMFSSYGGQRSVNYGICKKCSKEHKDATGRQPMLNVTQTRTADDNTCPRCGGKLRVRYGARGGFMGCSNYPKCNFTKSIRN